MHFTVELYGVLQRLAGTQQIELDLQLDRPACAADVLQAVAARLPAQQSILAKTAVARGDTLIQPQALLADGDRLALIPPVSGG